MKIKQLQCARCGRCQDICPNDAVIKYVDIGGQYYIKPELCKSCGDCKAVCPEDAIE